MHVLDFLGDPKCEKKPEDRLQAEYRLLCSGTLHRNCLGDYSKSEIARLLLDKPLLLFVVRLTGVWFCNLDCPWQFAVGPIVRSA